MISRTGLNDLIGEYRRALGKVNDAATILDDVSVFAGAAGGPLMRDSARLITDANALYYEIAKAISRLQEVTPDA